MMIEKRFYNYLIKKSRDLCNLVDTYFRNCQHSKSALITGFDTSHYLSGIQLLTSLIENTTNSDIYVFDLGLNEEQLKTINLAFPYVNVCEFNFSDYPEFFDIKRNAGQYAWKASIISKFLDMNYEHILWLDAGNKLIGDTLNIQKLIDKYGFFAVPTSNSILELTHMETIRRLEISIEKCHQLQLSAAFIGFCLKDRNVRKLIQDWSLYSRLEDVISPPGSNRTNHRQDQSLLNLLVVQDRILAQKSQKILDRRYSVSLYKVLTHQDID